MFVKTQACGVGVIILKTGKLLIHFAQSKRVAVWSSDVDVDDFGLRNLIQR